MDTMTAHPQNSCCKCYATHEGGSNATGSNNVTGACQIKENIVSWADLRAATEADPVMQDIIKTVREGFPQDARHLAAHVKLYSHFESRLFVLDKVLMLGDRVVVSLALRPVILSLLHAAHQGVTRMKSRSLESVYWPGITGDITKTREDCQACHKMATTSTI